MDFQFTDSENNFRNEVRDFTKKNLSTELKNKSLHYQTTVSYTHLRAHET